jgi:hypothetical protein
MKPNGVWTVASALRIGLQCVLFQFAPSGTVAAMTFATTKTPEGFPAVEMSGEIVPGDLADLAPILAHLLDTNRHPALLLDSPGGNILDALKLALVIKKLQLPVYVLAGDVCASACFLLFAASSSRHAALQARIGVHSASLAGDEDEATYMIDTIMARTASDYGVPADIIGRMVTTKPSEMAWLTSDELLEMQVSLVISAQADQPDATAPSSNPSRYGVHLRAPEQSENQSHEDAPGNNTRAREDAPNADVVPSPPLPQLVYEPGGAATTGQAPFVTHSLEPEIRFGTRPSLQSNTNGPVYVAKGHPVGSELQYTAGN